MRHFPVFLALKGRRVVVVGGGELAARKLRLIGRAGADLHVIAPEATAEIVAMAEAGTLTLHTRPFDAADLNDAKLVIVATGSDLDDRAAAAAHARNVPVNVVDRPELSSVVMPAIVDRDPVVIAIGSAGTAPVLVRRLREKLENVLPNRLGALALFSERYRPSVKGTIGSEAGRRRFWERFFDGPIAERVLADNETEAAEAMLAAINTPDAEDTGGRVDIVGAGPGDPDLLTLRAVRVLQDADVVVYDKLVDDRIMEYVRRDADRIYVGKAKGNHALPQTEINALLVELAQKGQRVVRLKGGDPFIFGRGGEELDTLRAAGIETRVVPGITAAAGCGASAGLPLTHRAHAQAVTFVTGHAKTGEAPDLDWQALARFDQTVVVYMGVSTAGAISARLIAAGMDATKPAAVIENGTRPNEIVGVGTVGTLTETIAAHAITGPAILVIGAVAAKATPSALPGLVDGWRAAAAG